MRRSLIAAAWVFGTTVPLIAGIVFTFGCCVLPFHHVIHKMMPVCEVVASVVQQHHDERPQTPAREKQELVKRVPVVVRMRAGAPAATQVRISTTSLVDATMVRSFISFGATRCDRDIGALLI